MSRGNSSINNYNNNNNNNHHHHQQQQPISKESSRSNSPFANYANEPTFLLNLNNSTSSSSNSNTKFLTTKNSRFKKVPVLAVNSIEMDPLSDSQPPRKRFEVEKVDENSSSQAETSQLLPGELAGAIDLGNYQNNTDTFNSQSSKKSALKKTVTKFEHDDSIEKDAIIPVVPKQPENTDDDDEDDVSNGSMSNCIKINYNKRKEARSVTINCGSSTANSYWTCFNDIKSLSFYKKLIAEYIGTMILVIYICGVGLKVAERDGVPGINGAIGNGLIVSTIVWCLGNISGAHVNPAVTIAFLLTGKINLLSTVLYIGFQLLGAITGSFILRDLVPEYALAKLSLNEIHPELNVAQGFGIECIITFILVLTVFSCVDESRSDINGSFPLSIGLAIIVGSLFGGPFTGGSMNPARSFGPAVVMNNWKDHWVFWVGPISGAIIAGILYKFILTNRFARRRSKAKQYV